MNAKQVIIHNTHPSAVLSPSFAKRSVALARKVLAAEKLAAYQVSVVLVDDPAMRRLNGTYRRQHRATDVLAFGFYKDRLTRTDYGDLYISLDRARHQASVYRVPYSQEILRLLVHGLLHLCGYDHENRQQERSLAQRVDRWLAVNHNRKG